MKLNLRLLPILVSAILSAALLFGGWFIYHSTALENPLIDIVRSQPGVTFANVDVQKNNVIVRLKLNGDANVAQIMKEIQTQGANTLGNRSIRLDIESDGSEALDHWWSQALFEVAQAMELRKYAEIPAALEQRSSQLPGLEVSTSMDQSNVYIHLNHESNDKFIILPRIPPTMGVWSDE